MSRHILVTLALGVWGRGRPPEGEPALNIETPWSGSKRSRIPAGSLWAAGQTLWASICSSAEWKRHHQATHSQDCHVGPKTTQVPRRDTTSYLLAWQGCGNRPCWTLLVRAPADLRLSKRMGPCRAAPTKKGGEKGPSAITEVMTREHTTSICKRTHQVGFKKHAPRALKEVWTLAEKEMGL